MKKFWVLWTYIANYAPECIEVAATDELDARNRATYMFGANFHREATIYVFSSPPTVFRKGEPVKP